MFNWFELVNNNTYNFDLIEQDVYRLIIINEILQYERGSNEYCFYHICLYFSFNLLRFEFRPFGINIHVYKATIFYSCDFL